jgi:hypothetical protein
MRVSRFLLHVLQNNDYSHGTGVSALQMLGAMGNLVAGIVGKMGSALQLPLPLPARATTCASSSAYQDLVKRTVDWVTAPFVSALDVALATGAFIQLATAMERADVGVDAAACGFLLSVVGGLTAAAMPTMGRLNCVATAPAPAAGVGGDECNGVARVEHSTAPLNGPALLESVYAGATAVELAGSYKIVFEQIAGDSFRFQTAGPHCQLTQKRAAALLRVEQLVNWEASASCEGGHGPAGPALPQVHVTTVSKPANAEEPSGKRVKTAGTFRQPPSPAPPPGGYVCGVAC